MQIVRLLDAIANRYDPLSYSDPLVAAGRDRYLHYRDKARSPDGRRYDFSAASQLARAWAIEQLLARGTGLVEPDPAWLASLEAEE